MIVLKVIINWDLFHRIAKDLSWSTWRPRMMKVNGLGLLAVMIWQPSTVKLFCFSPDSLSTDSIVLKPEKPPSEKRTKYLFLHVVMYSPLFSNQPFFTTLTQNKGRIKFKSYLSLNVFPVHILCSCCPPTCVQLRETGNGRITINIKLDNSRSAPSIDSSAKSRPHFLETFDGSTLNWKYLEAADHLQNVT